MLHPILFAFVPILQPTHDASSFDPTVTPAVRIVQAKDDAEYTKLKKEAGEDPVKLWKLYEWCTKNKKEKEAKLALRAILKVDPNHKDANVALGNIFFEGQWFASQKKIDEYKKEQELKAKKEQGLVEWKGQWVNPADIPNLEKGLVKDESGNWVDPQTAKKIAEGWTKQDLEWVAPADKEKVEKGLWKCGDAWLELEAANKYHSEIGHWWKLPHERFTLYTTCDRSVALESLQRVIALALNDVEKAYGTKAKTLPLIVVLRDQEQYSSYAGGNQEDERYPTDLSGTSGVLYAYPAEAGYDEETYQELATGIGYWDASTADGPKWGLHSVRHATGQAVGEALDPSTKAFEKVRKSRKPFDDKTFWAEKLIPRWIRFGAATYAERYFIDPAPGVGGDALWARKWSVNNIAGKGGLRPFKQLFEFDLNIKDPVDSAKLLNESGLMIAFCVDGGAKTVSEKFAAVQAAIKTAKDAKSVADATKALEAEIIKHEADLRKFAGL